MMLALMELFKRHTSQDSYKYRQFAGGLSMNIMALNLSFLKHKPCFVFSLLEEMQTNGEPKQPNGNHTNLYFLQRGLFLLALSFLISPLAHPCGVFFLGFLAEFCLL